MTNLFEVAIENAIGDFFQLQSNGKTSSTTLLLIGIILSLLDLKNDSPKMNIKTGIFC